MHFQDLIIDIQGHDSIFDGDPDEFKSQVVRSFQSMSPTLDFPSFLLAYDEEGLELFDDMQINSKWYYPFAAEKEILEVHGRDIVSTMLSRCTGDENASGTQIMLELGSGSDVLYFLPNNNSPHFASQFLEKIDDITWRLG
ncbi:hypothetical protein BS17DRAFT_106135 [Gyrodon lividus]|nr:hypothetical protein BS17DRAFT_106135 [Gyrodon lividus]